MITTSREQAIRANHERQRQAMIAGDADALTHLLADGFTLTHMTGYRQPKAEWLADIRSGDMAYHAMKDVEVSVTVDLDTAVLTARTVTEATMASTW